MGPSSGGLGTLASLIEIVGLSKSFRDGDRPVIAIDDLDLTVAEGEFVAIIGPSGCGKSTLLRLIAGLLEPDSGALHVNGDSPRTARREKRFGFVPQSPALLPWKTVRDNLTMLVDLNADVGRRPIDDAEADHLLARVGLAGIEDARPGSLSGGMRQRVSLARAFALRSPILLMDEPFSALDEITRSDMRFLLLELWQEATSTVVFVTHSIDEAVVLADRVIVLGADQGRLVAEEQILLPRPRHEDDIDHDQFRTHAASIRHALHEASIASTNGGSTHRAAESGSR